MIKYQEHIAEGRPSGARLLFQSALFWRYALRQPPPRRGEKQTEKGGAARE